MANERTGEHSAQPSADKSAAHRSRRRSGRSGRQPQNPAEQTSQAGNPAEQKSAEQSGKPSERKAISQSDNSPESNSVQRTGTVADRKSAEQSDNSSERRAILQSGNSSGRKSTSQPRNSADRKAAQQPGNSANRRSAPQPQNPSARKTSPPPQNPPVPKSASRWTWRDYLLQLSVVIVGIMVTFIGSDMISCWSRARQVKAVMQLVVDELKVNREPLQTVCQKLRYDRHGMLMLQRYDMDLDRIPRDTLDYYMNIIGAMESLWPQVDALEVLKSSGVIASIDNKQLLLDILGCYNRMQNLGDKVDTYNGRKMSALDHLFATNRDFSISNTNSYVGWKTFMNDPMCAAFLGTMAYYFGYEDTFDNYLIELDRTVESVTKKYSLE